MINEINLRNNEEQWSGTKHPRVYWTSIETMIGHLDKMNGGISFEFEGVIEQSVCYFLSPNATPTKRHAAKRTKVSWNNDSEQI